MMFFSKIYFLVTSYFTVQLINSKGKFIFSKKMIEGEGWISLYTYCTLGTIILKTLIHRVPPQ